MALADFLHGVLSEGRIHLNAAPTDADADDAEALVVLRRASNVDALSIAGPTLPLNEPTALAAGRLLHWAAWYFLNPNLPIENADRLNMPKPPATPEQHLSADLALRFLPTLHRRAVVLMKDDALPLGLEKTLRQWPFSGVLADIVEPPLTPVDFGRHAGLNFLYAERLADHERAGWFPLGHGRQYVELVWSQLGKDVSVLALAQELEKETPHE